MIAELIMWIVGVLLIYLAVFIGALAVMWYTHRDPQCPLCRTRHDPAHCPREYVEPLLKNLNKLN